MVDRALIRLLLALFAIALAILWLFAVITGYAGPDWAPPTALLALAVALLL